MPGIRVSVLPGRSYGSPRGQFCGMSVDLSVPQGESGCGGTLDLSWTSHLFSLKLRLPKVISAIDCSFYKKILVHVIFTAV